MATAFTHAFVALAAGRACFRERMPARFWVLAVACSAAPDLDVVHFAFGAGQHELWAHRGLTHSVPFALLLSLVVVTLAFRRQAPPGTGRWWGLLAFFFALTASHGFLDAFTDGGWGIAFLSPFDQGRHFMPWRPLRVPPIGLGGMFSAYGTTVLLGEMLLIWLPMTLLAAGRSLACRGRGKPAPAKRPAPPGC